MISDSEQPPKRKSKSRWRRYLVGLLSIVSILWLPDLVEIVVNLRPLPDSLAWETRFNGNGNEQDDPMFIRIDPAGQVLTSGMSYAGKGSGSWMAKQDGSTGHEVWRWLSNGALQSAPLTDTNGDVYFAGSETKGYRPGPLKPLFSGADTDFMVGKLSGTDGTLAWKTSFDGGLHDTDWAETLVLGKDGNPLAAGFTPDDTRYHGCVVKVDASSGKEIWQHRTRDESVVFWHGSIALQSDMAGDVVFASTIKAVDPFSPKAAFWLRKLQGADGSPVWTSEFPADAPQSHFLRYLAVNAEGDLIATGYHAKNRGRNLVVVKFAGKDGRVIWSVELDPDSHETIEPTCLMVDKNGDFVIGARSWNGSLTTPLFDAWIIKLSGADGSRVWSKRNPGSQAPYAAGRICSTQKLMVGPENMIVSAGSTWNGKDADVRVDWLSGADGNLIRSVIYDGPAHDHDLFRDAAIAPTGEIVVAQSSSRCPGWIKPFKSFLYRLKGGPDWASIHSETNELDDRDPFNYDSVLWRSQSSHPQRSP